jgi:hypothetical protein
LLPSKSVAKEAGLPELARVQSYAAANRLPRVQRHGADDEWDIDTPTAPKPDPGHEASFGDNLAWPPMDAPAANTPSSHALPPWPQQGNEPSPRAAPPFDGYSYFLPPAPVATSTPGRAQQQAEETAADVLVALSSDPHHAEHADAAKVRLLAARAPVGLHCTWLVAVRARAGRA